MSPMTIRSLGGGTGGASSGTGMGGGNSSIYQGVSSANAGDFKVVRAAATQLTLSELQFPVLFENFIAIYEYDGDNLVKSYLVEDVAYDWTWVPAADTSTGTLTLTTAAFGATNTFVVVISGPEKDELEVLTDFGGPYTHQSPRDFDVVWASATTLTIGGVTPMVMDPDVDQIRAVVEIATGGKVRMTYTRREWAFTWAPGAAGEGVLTITGATMQATSTFIMFVEGPEHNTKLLSDAGDATKDGKIVQHQDATGGILRSLSSLATAGFVRITNGTVEALLSAASTVRTGADVVLSTQPIDKSGNVIGAVGGIRAGHRGIWSSGQNDFTAVYLSPTTLTLGTFPTAMGTVHTGQIAMVVATNSAGVRRAFFPTQGVMTIAGQVLTVADAAFDGTDLDYDVQIWGPPKSYDASINGDQVRRLDPEWAHIGYDQKSASGLGDGAEEEYWDVETYHTWSAKIVDTPGATGSNVYTLEATTQNDGTAQESCLYIDVTLERLGKASYSSAELTADPTLAMWELNVPFNYKYVRIVQTRTGDGAATDGAYQYDGMWS